MEINYEENDLNKSNFDYFIDYVKNFPSREDYTEYSIYTPRHLMEEIIIECNGNSLKRNDNNNNMLCKNINNIIKSNYLVDDSMKKKLNYLKEKIYNKESDLVSSIAKSLKHYFYSKEYFSTLVDNLIILVKKKENKSEDIKEILNTIFVELNNIGYSYSKTRSKILDLFSTAKIDKEHLYKIRTSFPLDFIPNISKKSPENRCKFINELSICERINYLKNFYKDEEVYHLIVGIKGVSVKGVKVKCNSEITFYNPREDGLKIKGNKDLITMILKDENQKESCYVDVKLKARTNEEAYSVGLKKLENFLNLQMLISDLPKGYKIIKRSLLLLDKNKSEVGFQQNFFESNAKRKEYELENNSTKAENFLDKKNIQLNESISQIIYKDDNQKNRTDNLLVNSIKKYSDAIKSDDKQETVLKYWSAIESLFTEGLTIENKNNSYDLIEIIIPTFMAYVTRYNNLHQTFNTIYYNSNLETNPNKKILCNYEIVFPDKLIKKSIIEKDETILLKYFVENLNEMRKYTDRIYYLEKIERLIKEMNDKDYSLKFYNDRKGLFKDIVVNIYRLRNQIIHNALSNEITTNYYLKILKSIATDFLFYILKKYSEHPNLNINQIILELYSEAELYECQLSNTKEKDIFFHNQ